MPLFDNAPFYRLLDANANRAREGLRVVEDYARFVLDSSELTASLKHVRHDLSAALRPHLPAAILHRDTPADVGTAIKTPAEAHRSDLSDIVTAAGKRLGEALRAIEEALKVLDTPAAGAVEALRYRFYEIERRLALTLSPSARFRDVRLVVLVTESFCTAPWLAAAEAAILGGADCLQLREKNLPGAELLARAKQLAALCRKHHVLSIINDRPDIALLAGADGVHVGQEDIPAAEVRRAVGPEMILGVSTHGIDHARQAVLDGADYIGVGPVFPSATKPRPILPGLAYAADVAKTISIPGVAIAGIHADNVDQVKATGIAAIAVTAAVMAAPDIRAAAADLKKKFAGSS